MQKHEEEQMAKEHAERMKTEARMKAAYAISQRDGCYAAPLSRLPHGNSTTREPDLLT